MQIYAYELCLHIFHFRFQEYNLNENSIENLETMGLSFLKIVFIYI